MLENELKNFWQNSAENVKFNAERLANTYLLEKKIDKLDKSIHWRNVIEYCSIVIVVVSMSYNIAFLNQSTIKNLADFCGILASLWVGIVIFNTRKNKSKMDSNLPVLVELKILIDYFKKEQSLKEKIVLWYLLPFLPGFVFASIHIFSVKSISFFVAFVAVLITLNLVIWWINQNAAKKKYTPLIESLESQIKEWIQ
jgi:hypothetical protein